MKESLAKIVVEMIKREWPQKWETLFPDLDFICKMGVNFFIDNYMYYESKFPFFDLVVGLRWSALTMGGILHVVVCLAGASASMTVEANAWMTLSVAEVTRVYVWSIGAIALLSASPPFCGSL